MFVADCGFSVPNVATTHEYTPTAYSLTSAVPIFQNIQKSNSYFTIRFDSKWIQLFEIFKYLSLVHNAVFGDYNSDKNATNCHCFWRL